MSDIERALDALNSIDAGCSHKDWIEICMATKNAGLSFEDFDRWSKTSTKYHGEKDCRRAWNSVSANGGITANSLFYRAQQQGWVEPSKATRSNHNDSPLDIPLAEPTNPQQKPSTKAKNAYATQIWERCQPAEDTNPYIQNKQGSPEGVRVYPASEAPLIINDQDVRGWLVVPCWDGGNLQTLQFIPPDGKPKLNLKGCSFGEGCFLIGEITDLVYIVEGIGQAWAANKATNVAAAVCFGAGRMSNVAQALRNKCPAARIILVPDVGKEVEAASIAADIDGEWVEMPADKPSNYDANDFFKEFGADELTALLGRTKMPSVAAWSMLADPFSKQVVPIFPIGNLPQEIQKFCLEKSMQSGFDMGGYAISAIVTAGNMVDHRIRMNVGAFKVPPNIWLTINANSGAGKTPIINEIKKTVCEIDNETISRSHIATTKWTSQCKNALKNGTLPPPQPPWRQRNALDTTVEGLAGLLRDNPEGINIHVDELSEFIGRMDAYKSNGGADRAVYLRSYDGGQVTINRATKAPVIVENFSVGILAGVQPDKLTQMFRKSGGGSDGLFQRFLIYCLQPAGQCNYEAKLGACTEVNFEKIFHTLHDWTENGTITDATLDANGRSEMQSYHNNIRTLTARTPSQRFAEHLDKYPGMLGRMTFALHCIECAAIGSYKNQVAISTLNKAIEIMRVMYRHSDATYAELDSGSNCSLRLAVSAAEAILSKSWERFSRGDLTRNATYWQGAEHGEDEGAIDLLIELGWIKDITPSPMIGKRGRRSGGLFLVNPLVHQRFREHTIRIKNSRSERYGAIKKVACN